jgi:hypothetical protein
MRAGSSLKNASGGGAKAGANIYSHEAMPGDAQPASPQAGAILGGMGLRRTTGGVDLGPGGPGSSRHPDQTCR